MRGKRFPDVTVPAPTASGLVRVRIAVETPQHSGLGDPLDYLSEQLLTPGTLARVPLGRREVTGIVWDDAPATAAARPAPGDLRSVAEVFRDLPPLPSAWRELVSFAAGYYQRGVGELAVSVLPAELRRIDAATLARRVATLRKNARDPGSGAAAPPRLPELAPAQEAALQAIAQARTDEAAPVVLLHGVTGSGKTEVYLREAERVLASGRQVLVLVPEINLTPQLEARLAERFAGRRLVAMHSGLTPAQRLRHWLLAHLGEADLVLGTRLAVFAPLPQLGLVVVDEEHDASYKQQEGARYSARDLAVYRGRLEKVPVLLGSATPSLESWQRALEGRYRHVSLPGRIGGGVLPRVRFVDMRALPRVKGSGGALAPQLVAAIHERIARGEQSLLLLNRRGYAPVLHCMDCDWKSDCPHCSAWRVFHKADRTLRCHHCGFTQRVPRACPACGNPDIQPVGRGTEQLEEQIGELLGDVNGRPARVARIDADSARAKGALEALLASVHAGEVDVLVGTQMIAKGHDFRGITLVAAVNPDAALFASDFRAPERLFSLLMQAAGRAGRDAAQAAGSEMWVQTWHPRHPLYEALRRHDYEAFAASQLTEREVAGLPPFTHLALLRADARNADDATAFLRAAAQAAGALDGADAVKIYPPVPAAVARVANVWRMQMLIESPSRAALQRVLGGLRAPLLELRAAHRGVLRWAVDVDPLAI